MLRPYEIPVSRLDNEVLIAILANLLPQDLIQALKDQRRVEDTRTTFLLSGGGARGNFQAGAAAFLSSTNNIEYSPNLVCGTSVGAVNGILVTENTNVSDNRRLKELIRIWLQLRNGEDFYLPSDDLEQLDEDDIPDFIKDIADFDLTELALLFLGKGYNLHEDEIPKRGGGVAGGASGGDIALGILAVPLIAAIFSNPFTSFPALAGLGALGAIIYNGAVDAIDTATNLRSLFNFKPLGDLFDRHFNEELYTHVNASSVDNIKDDIKIGNTLCRLVSTDVRTGNIVWYDNKGIFSILEAKQYSKYLQNIEPTIIKHNSLFHPDRIFSDTTAMPPTSRLAELSFTEATKENVLGSSAIPFAFPPGRIVQDNVVGFQPDNTSTLFDGGVKEVIPYQASIDYLKNVDELGLHNLVISISCSPIFNENEFFATNRSILAEGELPETYGGSRTYWSYSQNEVEELLGSNATHSGSNILELGLRAVEQCTNEVQRTDLMELLALDFDLEHLIIAPTFTINGTGQIDAGLNQIALAYGWMRACDMVWLRDNMLDNPDGMSEEAIIEGFFVRYRNSDLIARLRMNSWRHEMRFTPADTFDDGEPSALLFEDGVIQLIRRIKTRLAGEISTRRNLYDAYRYDEFPSPEYFGFSNSYLSWLSFEEHSDHSYWFYMPRKQLINELTEAINKFGRLSTYPSLITSLTEQRDELSRKLSSDTSFLRRTNLWTSSFTSRDGTVIPAAPLPSVIRPHWI